MGISVAGLCLLGLDVLLRRLLFPIVLLSGEQYIIIFNMTGES